MGWWSIDNKVLDGGIHEGGTEMFNGDGPADIMGVALDAVIKEYESSWGRKPFREELRAAFNFVANGLELESANDR